MALQNFVDKVLPAISAAWLNAVDAIKFTIFDDATTKAQARTALTSDAPISVVQGGTGATTAAAARTNLGVTSTNLGVTSTADLADTTDNAKGDALIGSKRTLTGAVAFTLHTFNEYRVINLKTDFAAAGDGVTDDSSKFAAAIDALPNGGVIELPRGTYLVDDDAAVVFDTVGLTLIGEGRLASVIKRGANAVGPTIKVTANHCALRDFGIDNASIGADAIEFESCNECDFRFARILNVASGGIAVRLDTASSNTIRDVFCLDVDRALLVEDTSNNIQLFDFGFSSLSVTNPAIRVTAAAQVAFFGGIWEHKSTALLIEDGGEAISVYGVYVENIGTAALPDIQVGGGASGDIGFYMSGCYISQNFDTTEAHIKISEKSKNISIRDCQLRRQVNVSQNFITVNGGASVADGIALRDIGMANQGAFTAISVGGTPRRMRLENIINTGVGSGTIALGAVAGCSLFGTAMDVTIGLNAVRVAYQDVVGTVTDSSTDTATNLDTVT